MQVLTYFSGNNWKTVSTKMMEKIIKNSRKWDPTEERNKRQPQDYGKGKSWGELCSTPTVRPLELGDRGRTLETIGKITRSI